MGYLKAVGPDFCYAAVMDSDILFVRLFCANLPPCTRSSTDGFQGGASWDVAFTTYGPDFEVPWAEDAAKVGRTGLGFTRVNCGVVLLNMRNVLTARRFLKRWVHVSHRMITGNAGGFSQDDHIWEAWQQQLLDDFRGTDQAGLVLLVCSYETQQLGDLLGWGSGKCRVCQEIVEANLGLF